MTEWAPIKGWVTLRDLYPDMFEAAEIIESEYVEEELNEYIYNRMSFLETGWAIESYDEDGADSDWYGVESATYDDELDDSYISS